MRKRGSQKGTANGKPSAVRYPSIRKMVTEAFARIEPEGYAEMLQALRADWNPAGPEIQIVETMADLACRMRGCNYLEAEILSRKMAACPAPGGRQGPHLLDRVTLYYSRVSKDFARCVRLMERRAAGRRPVEQVSAATLADLKTCTPVVQ